MEVSLSEDTEVAFIEARNCADRLFDMPWPEVCVRT